jgi:ribonuclease P protein component
MEKTQCAVVVSKKNAQKAVLRNKIRRLTYYYIEMHGNKFITQGGLKVVFYITKRGALIEKEEIKADIVAFMAHIL